MEPASILLIAAVVFFIVFLGVALVVFRIIRRTMKLAFRLLIVGIILFIGLIGASSLWFFSSSGTPAANRPANARPAR